MKTYDLGKDKISKLFAGYAIPSIISMLGMVVFALVDGIVVGQFVGSSGLAAVSIAFPFILVALSLSSMVASGGFAQVTADLGAGNIELARSKFTLSFTLISIFSLILLVVAFVFGEGIARISGATPSLVQPVKDYMQFISIFCFFYTTGNLLDMGVRSMGKPNISMIANITCAGINILLDILFVAVFRWGIKGAALASGIGFIALFCIDLSVYLKKDAQIKFVKFKFDIKLIGKILANGSSEGLTQISVAIATVMFNLIIISRIGEVGVSAFAIIIYINDIVVAIFIGVSNAMMPIISFNFGANNYKRVIKTAKISFLTVIMGGVIATATIILFKKELVSIFNNNNKELLEISMTAAALFAPACLFSGTNVLGSAYFTALTDAKRSVILAACRSLIFVSIGIATLPIFFGNNGIWITVPFAEAVTVIVTVILLRASVRRLEKKLLFS